MALTTLNTGAISFKKLSGKVHTQQNFAVTEEGISTNVQSSFSTVFAQPIVKLPVTSSGLTSLYATNGIVERVKFEIDLIPDTQIAVGRSQGYRLKLPSDYNSFGELYPEFSAGTYLYTALGKLQIVPSLYGTLKPDGSTEYDPILYQTNGSTVIAKFDPINWYFDSYSGILFVQDPPVGYDSSAARPGYLEAFLYVGDYLDDIIFSGGTTGSTTITANNGITSTAGNVYLGGELTGSTLINGVSTHGLHLGGYVEGQYLTEFVVGVTSYMALHSNNYVSAIELQDSEISLIGNGTGNYGTLKLNNQGATLQGGSTGITFTKIQLSPSILAINDSRATPKGIEYIDDYSANYTDRSLVDKAWVLSQVTGGTSGGTVTANNGLTKIGNNIRLGGTLTGNTIIGGSASRLDFGINKFGVTTVGSGDAFPSIDFTSTNGGVNIQKVGGVGEIRLQSNSGMTFQVAGSGGAAGRLIVQHQSGSGTFRGMEYANNYSAQFVSRSIPDVAWVLSVIPTGSTTGSTGGLGTIVIVTGNTTLTNANGMALVTTTSTAITVTLPPSPTDRLIEKIKDRTGNAATNNITINGNGKNIDGSSTASIITNRGAVELIYSSVADEWFVTAFVN